MKFTTEELESALELVSRLGNEPDIRSEEFADFVRESFADGMAEDAETPGEFINICIDVFRDFKADEKAKADAAVIH